VSDDFDDAPVTVLDGPIPKALFDAPTGPTPKDAWWNAGREIGRAEGRSEILAALEDSLLAAGVPPADIPAILEKVLDRAGGA
jgi:hypothetical protein